MNNFTMFVRGSQTGKIFDDALVSGHRATHLNDCCDIDEPCLEADVEDYVFDDGSYAIPTKVIQIFTSLDEVEEYIKEQLK